eukprot:COSAG05_NODE_689_length_7904_cov_97.607816_4_plen_71_part_00
MVAEIAISETPAELSLAEALHQECVELATELHGPTHSDTVAAIARLEAFRQASTTVSTIVGGNTATIFVR